MKRETARELLIPYLDNELDPATTDSLREHLENDAELRRELEQLRTLFDTIAETPPLEPDAEMRARFDTMLDDARRFRGEHHTTRSTVRDERRVIAFPSLLRIAAVAAMVLGGVSLGWILAVNRSAPPGAAAPNSGEIVQLRRDVEALRGFLVSAQFPDRPASYRLQTISMTEDINTPDADIIEALFATLDGDKSANVRLAALEALSRFKHLPAVRSRLATALPLQSDALVQIALINVLVEAGGEESRAPLEDLLLRPEVPSIVKGRAQAVLAHL